MYYLNAEEKLIYLSYIDNQLTKKRQGEADSLFVSVWRKWMRSAEQEGVQDVLNRHLLAKRPVHFAEPAQVLMDVYDSFAGEVPLLVFERDEDFEQFVVNAAYRGETPADIHQMGASFLFNSKVLLIALSSKPYSNIPADEMGLDDAGWRRRSLILRREHECTHLYTRRFYGTARNNLHDELMADFFGLMAAMGRYKARWFQRFMGIGHVEGGRLSLYTQGLPDNVKQAVAETTSKAAGFLEQWARSAEFSAMSREEQVDFLCQIGIEGMC